MTVIYVDTLFFINGVVDYLLLLCAARVAGEVLHRGRYLIGALLGGGYAVAIFLPGGAFLQAVPCRLAVAVAMVLIAFGGCGRLLRQCLIFFALACAFGGGVLALSLVAGQSMALSGGVFYSHMDVKLLLLSAAVCYGGLRLLFARWGSHSGGSRGELVGISLIYGDRRVSFTGLMDTGNTLTDPVTGRRVMVAEGAAVAPILPQGCGLTEQALGNPVGAMEGQEDTPLASRLRLLPYRAVGVELGVLLALRVDGITINGVNRGDTLVALSPTAVSDGGNYHALVGADR